MDSGRRPLQIDHNRRAREKLAEGEGGGGAFRDWDAVLTFCEIVIAVDGYAELRGVPAPKTHNARRAIVRRHLPRLADSYEELYGLSLEARHSNGYAMTEKAWREAARCHGMLRETFQCSRQGSRSRLSPHGVVIHGRWRVPRLVTSWRVGPILRRRRDRVTWQATTPSWGYSSLLARDRLPARPCRWWTAGAPRLCPSPPNATGACGRAVSQSVSQSDSPNRRRLRDRVALGLPPTLTRCRRGPKGGPVRVGHRGERAALLVRSAGRQPRCRPRVLERVALSGMPAARRAALPVMPPAPCPAGSLPGSSMIALRGLAGPAAASFTGPNTVCIETTCRSVSQL